MMMMVIMVALSIYICTSLSLSVCAYMYGQGQDRTSLPFFITVPLLESVTALRPLPPSLPAI